LRGGDRGSPPPAEEGGRALGDSRTRHRTPLEAEPGASPRDPQAQPRAARRFSVWWTATWVAWAVHRKPTSSSTKLGHLFSSLPPRPTDTASSISVLGRRPPKTATGQRRGLAANLAVRHRARREHGGRGSPTLRLAARHITLGRVENLAQPALGPLCATRLACRRSVTGRRGPARHSRRPRRHARRLAHNVDDALLVRNTPLARLRSEHCVERCSDRLLWTCGRSRARDVVLRRKERVEG